MELSATHYADLARHAIQPVLDGAAPNGTKPDDCGPWGTVVDGVFKGYYSAGTPAARKVFNTLAAADQGISKMMAAGADQSAPAAHEWGGVLPFYNADLPPFPLDILPDWLREFCEAVTETMQTPTDLAGMLALAILSAICARRVEVRAWDGYDEPVNIYVVVAMPPGSGKSPVFKMMTSPISMYEWQELEKAQSAIEQAEDQRDVLEQRITAAKRKAATVEGANATKMAFSDVEGLRGELKDLEIPVRPKLLIDDATPESVTSILSEQDGRIAVLSSEGDIFAIMSGRYSSGSPNIGVYKKGHVGDDIRVDRKSRSEVVRRPAITMGITTQPEVMRAFGQNKTFQSEGLLARFFYAMPKSTVGSRKTITDAIPEEVKNLYFYRVLNMLENLNSRNSRNSRTADQSSEGVNSSNSKKNQYNDIFNNIIYIEISALAKVRFNNFRAWIEPQLGPYGTFAHMADWASKLAGYVLRVAGLLHMADVAPYNSYNSLIEQEISDATLARAIRFTEYLVPHAQSAYAEIGSDPAVEGARLVLRWIEKNGVREFAKQKCYQGVKGTLKRADDLDPVLSLLCDHGYLREIPAPDRAGPGRKAAPSYEVNPIVFDGSHNSYNSYNSLNTGVSYQPPAPPADDEPPTYRSIEGYD